MQQTLLFEHPLNERMRIFLRTEHLFKQLNYRYSNLSTTWDSRDCIIALIELYNLIEQTELRSELYKEIERHLNNFQRMTNTAAIDQRTLSRLTQDLENSSEILKSYSAKQGIFPKENDLLNPVRQRLMIPGGTCSFDLPAFHYWTHTSLSNRQNSLQEWMAIVEPLEKILELIIQLTRKSHPSTQEIAVDGKFQKGLPLQANCQLLRINVHTSDKVYPEISANKHRMHIRFLLNQGAYSKNNLTTNTIPFELTCCMI